MTGPALGPRLLEAAARFTTVASSADPTVPVPATPAWRVADLVTHVAIECNRYRRELEGDSDWSESGADIAETNRRALAATASRDVDVALDGLGRDLTAYVDLLGARPPDVPSHHLDGGLLLAPRHAAGLLLGELVVHGRDIAEAGNRPTGVDRQDALNIVTGALHAIPGMLDRRAARGHTATVEVRLRGDGTHAIQLVDGTATVTAGTAARRDAVLSVDPVGFLLLSYGRRGRLATILRGHLLAWGRRPDRALLLDRLVHRP